MYGPTLPVTSGGIGVIGLTYGITTQSLPIIGIGLIGIGLLTYSLIKLRIGEAKLPIDDD